jgi:GNAT superfamily N-acetyltransferase
VTLAEGEPGKAPLGAAILSQDTQAGTLTVDMLAVAPEMQGKGLGRRLLDHAEAKARDAGRGTLLLHTVAKYDHLIGYYERFGFCVTHHGPRPKGDDGFPRAFLAKTLKTTEVQE